ncbi:MAG: phosphoribosylformylglycinamidine cyclo-ligase [Planctomycetaceae bacterium]|jgi:phosphoribosylformylglycinamidine cyclo-ligase|nr:phosphoribosylformylglycinamidine cyclo-ligase [Planctomycetaceae bacterium]
MASKVSYKDSGVDLDVYAESMSRLPKLAGSTFSERVMRLDGGFAGLFRLNGGVSGYVDPVLVSCTDGVGTKLKIASAVNCHDTVGIDLVAMSVNDAICCGAEPLFFLDYVAMPCDDPDLLESIVKGIVVGCCESGCALLGGETAILSGVYSAGEYDLAGFCVGVVERNGVIDGKSILEGDILIGVESSGLHSNGFSLVRKILFDVAGLSPFDLAPLEVAQYSGQTISDLLLKPTRIYVKTVLNLLNQFGANSGISGIAHITGGGLVENVSRILPDGLSLQLDRNWNIPPIFKWISKLGEVDNNEMERVFNMGIGLVLIVKPEIADQIIKTINFKSQKIGKIIKKL